MIYGDAWLEAVRLDEYLKVFTTNDGKPIPKVRNMVPSPSVVHIEERVTERLLEEGMLKIYYDGYVITSKGMEFITDGGYKKQLLYRKASRLSVWLSIAAVLISIASFIRSC